MKYLDLDDFILTAGLPMHQRDMSAYNGKSFDCACGQRHEFDSYMLNYLNFVASGANAKMIVNCPLDARFSTLIETKYKFLVIFDRFHSIAGNKSE